MSDDQQDYQSPETLIARAVQGEKLSVDERRQAIDHIDRNRRDYPDYTSNYKLAALFGVAEATIRADKLKIRDMYAEALTADAASAFVAEHIMDLERLIADAWKACYTSNAGGNSHREWVKVLTTLLDKRLTVLQETGVIAKHLGELNVLHERWVAKVDQNGVTTIAREDAPPSAADTPVATP